MKSDKEIPLLVNQDKDNCCGCGLCVLICSKNCISMQEDTEGFKYPVVEESLCVRCNRCLNSCFFKIDQKKNL